MNLSESNFKDEKQSLAKTASKIIIDHWRKSSQIMVIESYHLQGGAPPVMFVAL